MFVRDVMKKTAAVCTEDMPLTKVYRLMQKNNCDYVTVVESLANQMPIGIITEHEICLQVIGKGRDPRTLTAGNVMNTDVFKAPFTLSVADCSSLMKTNKAKRALIVNEDGMFCGTLTEIDLEKTDNKIQIEKTERNEKTGNIINGEVYRTYNDPGINRIF